MLCMACDVEHQPGQQTPDADIDGGDDAADAADAGPTVPQQWYEPDPLCRITADNRLEALPGF